MRIVVAPMVFLCGCSQWGSTSGYGGPGVQSAEAGRCIVGNVGDSEAVATREAHVGVWGLGEVNNNRFSASPTSSKSQDCMICCIVAGIGSTCRNPTPATNGIFPLLPGSTKSREPEGRSKAKLQQPE